MAKLKSNEEMFVIKRVANAIHADSQLFAWLISLPAIKAQAYFWNYSSRRERRKAMLADMHKEKGGGDE